MCGVAFVLCGCAATAATVSEAVEGFGLPGLPPEAMEAASALDDALIRWGDLLVGALVGALGERARGYLNKRKTS